MEWWIKLVKVLGKTGFMIVLCVVMRIKYWINPASRKRDIENMQKNGKYEITEDNKKYWVSSDPDNLTNFLWTSKQISAAFNAMWQDLNKVLSMRGGMYEYILCSVRGERSFFCKVNMYILSEFLIIQTAGEFGPAPNPVVHHPDTGASLRLLDVAVPGQPLVINFGSCT